MISQRKIAEHLNLGRSTVANILRGENLLKYSEETRQAVMEAAERFGYRPNRASRSIRIGRTNVIGVIHFGGQNEVSRRAFNYLAKGIADRGYDLYVLDLTWYDGSISKAVDKLVEMRVEGVVICYMADYFGAAEIDILKRAKIPAVSIGGNEKWGIPTVHGDAESSLKEVVKHLISVGHQRLHLLTNNYKARTTGNRIAGFKAGILEAGGTILDNPGQSDAIIRWPKEDGLYGRITQIEVTPNLFEPAYQYVNRLIDADILPDAFVCSNDQWARQTFLALLQRGVKVPDDVAVTGFDNDQFCNYPPYYLTTVAQPIEAECEKVVELLLALIKGEKLQQDHFVFPCSLVVRKSSSRPLPPGKR